MPVFFAGGALALVGSRFLLPLSPMGVGAITGWRGGAEFGVAGVTVSNQPVDDDPSERSLATYLSSANLDAVTPFFFAGAGAGPLGAGCPVVVKVDSGVACRVNTGFGAAGATVGTLRDPLTGGGRGTRVLATTAAGTAGSEAAAQLELSRSSEGVDFFFGTGSPLEVTRGAGILLLSVLLAWFLEGLC